MRRPVVYAAVTVALLAALGAAFLRVNWGAVDAAALPEGTDARVVAEALETRFPHNAASPIEAVVTGTPDRAALDAYEDRLAAVATGVQRTGAIITSAALLFVVVIGAFATSGVTSIKMVGIGMVIAIVLDATIVRALLVPATMRLMGRANWWAPGPLARIYRRYGIREDVSGAPPPASRAEPAGRTASR